MRAKCLSEKGTIGLCSPSHVAEREEYQNFIAGIRRRGYTVREADNLYKKTWGYLATPQERAEDFNRLIADPQVELVFFGGGEGSNELLPFIDFEQIRRNPKRICSYSDGTTILEAIWALTGLETYYGQTPKLFADFSAYDEEQFHAHLVQGDVKKHVPNSAWQVQTSGRASGILIGGYCRNFAMLLGNRYFPVDLKQKYILFLEDYEGFGGVDYVSAMLSHMEQYDFMQSVAGLVFGHYSENVPPDLLARLRRLGEKYRIPVVYCDDFGHGKNHAIFPIGRKAQLDTEEKNLTFC